MFFRFWSSQPKENRWIRAAPPRNSPPPQSAPPTAPVRPGQSRPPPGATRTAAQRFGRRWVDLVGTSKKIYGDSMGDGWKPQKMKKQKSEMNLLSGKWRCSGFELLTSRSVERHMGADFPIIYYRVINIKKKIWRDLNCILCFRMVSHAAFNPYKWEDFIFWHISTRLPRDQPF